MIAKHGNDRPGYWTFEPAGIAVPGFIRALFAGNPTLEERCWQRYRARCRAFELGQWSLIPFALEAQHQAAPITSLAAVGAALDRIGQDGHDFGPAIAMAQALDATTAHSDSERRAAADAARRRAQAVSCEDRLARELAAKHLPAGLAANMALIREMLNVEGGR